MKILEAQSAVLPNFEVFQHLHEQRQLNKQTTPRRRGPPNLETVVTELLQYFETAPGPLKHPVVYDATTMTRFMDRIRAARLASELAKGEVLMILNLRPSSVAGLNTAIEDMESRFPETEQEKLLEIIGEVLGGAEGAGARNGNGDDVTMQSVEGVAGA